MAIFYINVVDNKAEITFLLLATGTEMTTDTHYAKRKCTLIICVEDSLSPVKQAESKAGAGVTTKKEASQWCDVGIMKGTTCVVSYYHLTSDVAQGNGDVSPITLPQCSHSPVVTYS